MDAITCLKNLKPRSSSHKIIHQDDYLDGVVAFVNYKNGSDEFKHWIIATKKHQSCAESESQLIQQMSAAQKENRTFEWKVLIPSISGIIALILVSSVVYIAISDKQADVPEFLKTSLSIVLGFYFGGITQKRATYEKEYKPR